MGVRVLITGSRTWADKARLEDALNRLNDERDIEVLISGECPKGADRMGENWARRNEILLDLHPAEWNRHDEGCPEWHLSQSRCRRAGFRRNAEMVNLMPDIVLAFQMDNSAGTQSTIDLARNKGIETLIHQDWTKK